MQIRFEFASGDDAGGLQFGNLVRRHLAETELSVGRFYLKQKQYPAAVVRFRRVLDANLADRVTEEAAYLLAVAYERDGQIDQAAEAVRSLLTAFPQSRSRP